MAGCSSYNCALDLLSYTCDPILMYTVTLCVIRCISNILSVGIVALGRIFDTCDSTLMYMVAVCMIRCISNLFVCRYCCCWLTHVVGCSLYNCALDSLSYTCDPILMYTVTVCMIRCISNILSVGIVTLG